MFFWRGLFRRELSETRAVPEQYRTLALLAVLALVVLGIGSLVRLGVSGALGLESASVRLSFFGVLLGSSWLFAVMYGSGTVRAVNQLLVSIFLGSTVLTALLAYTLLFNGGYAEAGWVLGRGVLLVFAVMTFLMVAFAMFQKRSVKLLWSASIALHLGVLFAWDALGAWLVLIAGLSALLAFQMRYSKKLWQRNFIYPLQVWAAAVLLLIIPVKAFTSLNVPRDSVLASAASWQAVAAQGFSLFGQGLGNSGEYVLVSGMSFDDFGSLDAAVPALGNGYLQLYLESGALGSLGWMLFTGALLVFGIRFWRANVRSFKEGTMSEGAYLGAVALLALALGLVGLWFFAFSFLTYWLAMALAGSAMVLWHEPDREVLEGARRPSAAARALSRGGRTALRALVALMTVLYIALLALQFRLVRAEGAARSAAGQADVQSRAVLWQRATSLAPQNREYRLGEVSSLLDLLAAPLSIDAQRAALERITHILGSAAAEGSPIAHWRAAGLYRRLDKYAEGSASLARAEYQTAYVLWPENVALAAAISEFYRSSASVLVSGDVSTAMLRVEAREGLDRALSLAPDYLPARLELALIVEQEAGAAAALSELELWEAASPEIAYHVARLYLNDDKPEEAVERLRAVIREVPNHSNAHYSLGVAYFRLEEYQESLAEFEAVLALNPGSEDVQAKIDQVKERLGH